MHPTVPPVARSQEPTPAGGLLLASPPVLLAFSAISAPSAIPAIYALSAIYS
jgi:hypothetical protein